MSMTGARIGFLQNRPRFGQVERNLERAAAALEAHCRGNPLDLVVLPELAFTGYSFRSREELASLAEPIPGGPTVRALESLARSLGTLIVAGLPEEDGGRLFNSAVAVGPEGLLGWTRKVHLFAAEKEIFDPGDRGFPVVHHPPLAVGLMICFDWAFPEAARSLALAGANIIAHPSNLVLPHAQEAMRTRCLENAVFAITANRVGREARGRQPLVFTGRSQVTGPRGEVLLRAGAVSPTVRSVVVDLERACDKHLTPWNHLLLDRRPSQYRLEGLELER